MAVGGGGNAVRAGMVTGAGGRDLSVVMVGGRGLSRRGLLSLGVDIVS